MAEKGKTVFALSDIVLDEVSLVDVPANDAARVVLFKRADDEIAKLIKQENGKWILYTKDGQRKLGTFDTEAQAIAQERAIQVSTRKAANTTKEGHDMTLETMQATVEKLTPRIVELEKSRDAEKGRADTAEAEVAKLRKQHAQPPEDKRTEAEKLLAKLGDDTRKSVEKLQTDNDALRKRHDVMERDNRLTKAAAELEKKYPNLPMSGREAAQALEKLDKDEAASMEKMFAASNAAFGEILREHGTATVSDGSDSLAKLMKAARDIQKAEKITLMDAIERAEQENPELVREQQSEQ